MILRMKLFMSLILTFLLIITSSSNVLSYQFDKNTSSVLDFDIIIPDDYQTIQQGINNAEPNDIIYVRSGIYKEKIAIDKEGISLIGENKYNTLINAEKKEYDAVTINADYVSVEGFNITNARCKEEVIWWNQSGIVIHSSNVSIKNNIFFDNRLGLLSYYTALNLTIRDNLFFYDGIFPACYIKETDGENQCSENLPKESIFIDVSNNTINGKPLYFLQNIHDTIVENDAGQVILVNCTNITVKDLHLTNLDFSIMLYYCSNCNIENNTITNSDGELILFFSENNTIQKNTITNAFHGTCLDIGSKNNIVRLNKIYDSMLGITLMTKSSGNRVYRNIIQNCRLGLRIISVTKNLPSHDNFVYENEFYKNFYALEIANYKDPLCYTYNNTVNNNTFLENIYGIIIKSSEGNIIKNNTFKKNLISAYFKGCSDNIWYNNYWNRPRLLPKIIFGFNFWRDKIPMLCINIDKNPAKKSTV